MRVMKMSYMVYEEAKNITGIFLFHVDENEGSQNHFANRSMYTLWCLITQIGQHFVSNGGIFHSKQRCLGYFPQPQYNLAVV